MNPIEVIKQQIDAFILERDMYNKLYKDNATARSRAGKKAKKDAEQNLKRINNQLDDLNKKLLQLEKQEVKETVKVTDSNNQVLISANVGSSYVNPKTAMWNGISQTASSLSTTLLGGYAIKQGGSIKTNDLQVESTETTKNKSNSLIYLVLGVFAMFLLLKKK